jgi:hypothetical protein
MQTGNIHIFSETLLQWEIYMMILEYTTRKCTAKEVPHPLKR